MPGEEQGKICTPLEKLRTLSRDFWVDTPKDAAVAKRGHMMYCSISAGRTSLPKAEAETVELGRRIAGTRVIGDYVRCVLKDGGVSFIEKNWHELIRTAHNVRIKVPGKIRPHPTRSALDSHEFKKELC